MERALLKQRDEATAESEEIGGAHNEGLQELIEIAARVQLGRYFEKLMQFMRLGMCGRKKLSVRHRHGAEAGNR